MSSSDTAIAVRGVSKSYTIRHQTEVHTTVAEAIIDRLRHPLRRTVTEEFWALQDVDLQVHRGEILGVVGRNGAGKSTLLKLLSRITSPTHGEIRLAGRVGSLLEVGTGFHPELTGRENVYLNGSILGMRQREIDKRFDEIIDFSGVGQFLDTPVKRYSSGMYVRLAFAVAAHMDTDILLVDEVLAVGDADFQEKSLAKMRDAGTSGRTVVLVSHNMTAVRQFSTRAVLLDSGAVICAGPTGEVLDQYRQRSGATPAASRVVPPGEVVIHGVEALSAPDSGPGDLHYSLRATSGHDATYRVTHTVVGEGGPVGSGASTAALALDRGVLTEVHVKVTLPSLAPGSYWITVALSPSASRVPSAYLQDGAHFVVPTSDAAASLGRIWDNAWGSVVFPDAEATVGREPGVGDA